MRARTNAHWVLIVSLGVATMGCNDTRRREPTEGDSGLRPRTDAGPVVTGPGDCSPTACAAGTRCVPTYPTGCSGAPIRCEPRPVEGCALGWDEVTCDDGMDGCIVRCIPIGHQCVPFDPACRSCDCVPVEFCGGPDYCAEVREDGEVLCRPRGSV